MPGHVARSEGGGGGAEALAELRPRGGGAECTRFAPRAEGAGGGSERRTGTGGSPSTPASASSTSSTSTASASSADASGASPATFSTDAFATSSMVSSPAKPVVGDAEKNSSRRFG